MRCHDAARSRWRARRLRGRNAHRPGERRAPAVRAVAGRARGAYGALLADADHLELEAVAEQRVAAGVLRAERVLGRVTGYGDGVRCARQPGQAVAELGDHVPART